MNNKVKWKNDADISWIDTSRPMVAVCFDDGPMGTADGTPQMRIQNAVAENGFHATFFYTINLWDREFGEDQKKEILRAKDLGFEIANHTWSHKDLSVLSAEELKDELGNCSEILTELTGKENFLIRPPYLNISETLQENAGAPLITCSVDTCDWDNATADQMVKLIEDKMNEGTLKNSVVLMHEVYDSTAEAVERIMTMLKDKGWQAVTVSEMFKANGIDMYCGQVYEHA